MKSRIAWLILVGAATAGATAVVGSAAVALRRGCALAGEDADLFFPENEVDEGARLASVDPDR